MTPMRLDLPYLSAERSRHGKVRYYVRRAGRRIRLADPVGSPAFLDAYRAALASLAVPAPARARAPVRGTLGHLAALYFASAEFRRLDPVSQRTRQGVILACLAEPTKPSGGHPLGDCPLAKFGAAHLRLLRDRKAATPGAANNRLKYLSALLGWAVDAGHMPANPARDVRPLRYATDGFHTWTEAEVAQFEARHPVGTKARLALALLLYSGVRRGDVVTLGRQHVRDGWLRFVPRKTRHRRKRLSEKPLLPALAAVIAASPTGDLTFLVTDHGRPFTAAGFGNWFRKRCDEAGLPHCSAHGLRKAGATLAAEAGATVHQLMALFDWSTPAQAEPYTRAADRRRLAAAGISHLAAGATQRSNM